VERKGDIARVKSSRRGYTATRIHGIHGTHGDQAAVTAPYTPRDRRIRYTTLCDMAALGPVSQEPVCRARSRSAGPEPVCRAGAGL
jgi:hypothetical protein